MNPDEIKIGREEAKAAVKRAKAASASGSGEPSATLPAARGRAGPGIRGGVVCLPMLCCTLFPVLVRPAFPRGVRMRADSSGRGDEMSETKGRVSGARAQRGVTFFGLSTCAWCKKTRAFLEAEGVAFDFFYVDLLSGDERDRVMAELARHNPRMNFPTVVVESCVVPGSPRRSRAAVQQGGMR